MKVQAIRGTVETTIGALWRKLTADIQRLQGNTSSVVIQARQTLETALQQVTDRINAGAPASATTWAQKLAWADTMPASYEQTSVVNATLQDIGQGLNRLNPLFVGARAAVLALVAGNFNGLADKMRAANPDRARAKWEGFGGDWAKMQEAMSKGAGTAQGVGFSPLLIPVIDMLAQGGPVPDGPPAPGRDGSGGGLASLWKVAKPIIEPILSLLGINPGAVAPTPQQVAEDAPAATGSGKTVLVVGGVLAAVLLLSRTGSN